MEHKTKALMASLEIMSKSFANQGYPSVDRERFNKPSKQQMEYKSNRKKKKKIAQKSKRKNRGK
jgi:hypothetical protein